MEKQNKININDTALLVVDMQNDYCHERGFLAKQGEDVSMIQQMLPNLQQFIERARKGKLRVIFIKTIHEESTDSDTWCKRINNQVQEGLCRKDSWGAEFYNLNPMTDEVVVIKHRYSAFIHTRLESILKTYQIKNLIMSGVSTNVCVESTARDGFMLDYGITLLSDCTAAFSRKEHEMTLHNIGKYFGDVCESSQILEAVQAVNS